MRKSLVFSNFVTERKIQASDQIWQYEFSRIFEPEIKIPKPFKKIFEKMKVHNESGY